MKSFKKTMMALAFAGVATQVQAGQFYVDMTGTSVGTGADGVCVNCTGLKDQVDFSYDSFTTITLGDGMLDVGDAIHTTGGLNTGNLLTFDDNNAGQQVAVQTDFCNKISEKIIFKFKFPFI